MRLLILFTICSSLIATASAQDGTGLQYSVAADIVGELGLKKIDANDPERDRITAREVEIMFYGPIDHNFDGMVSAAAHYEAGEMFFEMHEAYVASSKLIPRSRIKAGQFFLGVGRLNRYHRHDWPFISAPRMQEEFFDDEAALDTGLEYGWLAPTPFPLDIVVGVTSGFNFGHSHTSGVRPLFPTHYTRISSFTDIGLFGGMEVGLNYLGRRALDNERLQMAGLDGTFKWRKGRVLRWLLQSELWLRHLKSSAGATEKVLAGYLYPQYGFNQTHYLGIRLDGYNELNRTNAITNQREKNITWGVVPTYTYQSSEFAKFRIAYGNYGERELSETQFTDHTIEVQATFILGAHPAHDF